MDTVKIIPQVEQLIQQIGKFVTPNQQGMLNGTSTMISIIFGYKLLELSMVSLCVTGRSKGLLPDDAIEEGATSLANYAKVLIDYGLIEQTMHDKLMRLDAIQPELNQELLALSQSMNSHQTILDDIRHVLLGTEGLVQQMCEDIAVA